MEGNTVEKVKVDRLCQEDVEGNTVEKVKVDRLCQEDVEGNTIEKVKVDRLCQEDVEGNTVEKVKVDRLCQEDVEGNTVEKVKVDRLCQEDVEAKFQANHQQKLIISPCNDNHIPDTLWDNLKSAILKKSDDVLGYTKKNNKDWPNKNDKEIQNLLSEKREAHEGRLAQPTCPAKKASF